MDGSRATDSMDDLAVPVDAFSVVIAEGPGGSAVVTKDHSGPLPPGGRTVAEHARAVDRERTWLLAAAVDGIVTLADWADSTVVATIFAGGATLRSHPPAPAGLVAALLPVCDALASLRDRSMVHGSLAPEHVIIGSDGGGVLCSPNTGPNPLEHADDLAGLGRTLTYCIDSWSTLPAPPEHLERWLLLARRLEDGDPTMSVRRVASTLVDLVEPSPSRRGRPRLVGLGLALLAAVAMWALVRRPVQPAADGPEVQVDGTMIRVGRAGQAAVAVETRPGCEGPRLYLLDPATSWVWVFDTVDHGVAGTPLARVPGATALVTSEQGTCPVVTATGPAGRVDLHP